MVSVYLSMFSFGMSILSPVWKLGDFAVKIRYNRAEELLTEVRICSRTDGK